MDPSSAKTRGVAHSRHHRQAAKTTRGQALNTETHPNLIQNEQFVDSEMPERLKFDHNFLILVLAAMSGRYCPSGQSMISSMQD